MANIEAPENSQDDRVARLVRAAVDICVRSKGLGRLGSGCPDYADFREHFAIVAEMVILDAQIEAMNTPSRQFLATKTRIRKRESELLKMLEGK